MSPIYDRDGIAVYHADCMDVLPNLSGVDAVVTDPPYGVAYASNYDNRQGTSSATWKGRVIFGDHDTAARDAVLAWAVERGIPWACFGSHKAARPANCRGVLIWDKGPANGMGDLSFPWKPSWEEIYIGGPGWVGKRDEGVLKGHTQVSWESKGRRHQNQKPVSLIVEILRKLPVDHAVLDPFAGSGTTGVACLKSGRRCILVEKDERYIPVIIRRLQEAETPLFRVSDA